MKNEDKGKNKGKLKYIGVAVAVVFLAGVYLASATTVITDIQMAIGNVTIREDEIQVGANITITGKGMVTDELETCRVICDKSNVNPNSRMNFFIDGVAPANMKMTILDNGNVGIGMMSPEENLDVQGVIHSHDGMRAGSWQGGVAYWQGGISNQQHEILCHNCYWNRGNSRYEYLTGLGGMGTRMIAFQKFGMSPSAPGPGIHFYQKDFPTPTPIPGDPIAWSDPQFSILTDKVNVNDVLRLEPRSTPPPSPSVGDIYVDDAPNNQHIYCYLRVAGNPTWKQLDN